MYVYLFPLQDKGKDGHIREPEEDRGTIQYSANQRVSWCSHGTLQWCLDRISYLENRILIITKYIIQYLYLLGLTSTSAKFTRLRMGVRF